jgi:hypothetical protein
LRKNCASSLRGLQYLLEHVPQALIDDSVLNEKSGGTVFHYLLNVQETIRDDDLSHDILKMLLAKFSKPGTLDIVDKFGFTAMMIAVRQGNHLAVETLLHALPTEDGEIFIPKSRTWRKVLQRRQEWCIQTRL